MGSRIQNHLGAVRSGRGMSIAELAKRVGVSRQTVYAIEAGSYVPNTEVALRIGRELEVSVEELFRLIESGRSDETAAVTTEFLSSVEVQKGQAVRTCKVGAKWVSVPASATPYHLPEADGILAPGERRKGRSKVLVFPQLSASKRLLVAGCDPAASVLAHMAEKTGDVEVVHAPASSQLALTWLKEGKVHVAGTHLEDSRTGEFNTPFVRRQFVGKDMTVVTFAEWEVGFVVAAGNPKSIRRAEDLSRKNVRFVNREVGAGSRALLDKLLRKACLSGSDVQGYDRIAQGHLAAAYAVFSQEADCCLATQSAARAYGLDFVTLHRERYDFVFSHQTLELPQTQAFMDVLQRSALRRKLETLAGYDTTKTGTVID